MKRSFFVQYGTYLVNFDTALITVHLVKSLLPRFKNIVEQFENHLHQTLESLLSLPTERLPKYTKALGDILAYTSATHPDYHALCAALRKANTITAALAASADISSATANAKKLISIAESIPNIEGKKLLKSGRKFLYETDASAVITKDASSIEHQRSRIFLFDDILVFCVPQEDNPSLFAITEQYRTADLKGIHPDPSETASRISLDFKEGHCAVLTLPSIEQSQAFLLPLKKVAQL